MYCIIVFTFILSYVEHVLLFQHVHCTLVFTETLCWTQIDFLGPIESLFRTGHTAFCLPYCHGDKEHEKVYIVGGGDNNELFFNDIHQLTIPLQIKAGATIEETISLIV